MTDFNRVTIHGRIARNCESTKSDAGLKIVRFLLASNKTRVLSDGKFEDESSFFPLAVFGEYAGLVEHRLNKGQGVLVEGRLYQHRWSKDGVNHSELVIRVDHLYFDPVPVEKNGVADDAVNLSPAGNHYRLEQVIAENPSEDDFSEAFSVPAEPDYPLMNDVVENMAFY